MGTANSSTESVISAKTIIACALTYTLLFYLNDWLTAFLEAAPGVNWIYLPAGLRLFLVLVFGLSGAIGISIASTLITFGRDLSDDIISMIGIGLISGFGPYIARLVVVRNLKINADLSNLNIQMIAISVLVFALLSTGLHQLWFVLIGIPSGSLSNAIAMLVGDVLGALLFISICKFGINLYKKLTKRESLL